MERREGRRITFASSKLRLLTSNKDKRETFDPLIVLLKWFSKEWHFQLQLYCSYNGRNTPNRCSNIYLSYWVISSIFLQAKRRGDAGFDGRGSEAAGQAEAWLTRILLKCFHIHILGSISLTFTFLNVIAAFKEQKKKSFQPQKAKFYWAL